MRACLLRWVLWLASWMMLRISSTPVATLSPAVSISDGRGGRGSWGGRGGGGGCGGLLSHALQVAGQFLRRPRMHDGLSMQQAREGCFRSV